MNFNSYFTIKHTSNLRILLLTLFFIVPLGTIYGQNQLITIAGKNITLLKAFDAIESQTQLSITYSRTKIDVNRTLSVDFKKQKLSIVLDKLLAGTGFTYKIEKGYIVLVPVPVKQEQTEATSKKKQVFTLPVSYTTLAEYLCVDRSAMMREFKNLSEEGVLFREGKNIRILL